MDNILDELKKPFDITEIKQRPLVTKKDKSAALPANYIDARAVAQRLDDVVGPMWWKRDHKEIKGIVYAGVGIYNTEIGEWIWKWDSGAESNMEKEKGEASDSFKRAAVNWGIGRFLYELPEIWVDGYAKGDKFFFDRAALKEYRQNLKNYLETGEIPQAQPNQKPYTPGQNAKGYKATQKQYDFVERLVKDLDGVLSDDERADFLDKARQFTEKPSYTVKGEKVSSKSLISDMIEHLKGLKEQAENEELPPPDADGDQLPF